MKKWVIISIIFAFLHVIYHSTNKTERGPASVSNVGQSCADLVLEFDSFGINHQLYKSYLQQFQDNSPVRMDSFLNLEHLFAWSDFRLKKYGISFTKTILNHRPIRKAIEKKILSMKVKGSFYGFLFKIPFEKIIERNLEIDDLSPKDVYIFKKMLRRKIVDDFFRTDSDKIGLWTRVANSSGGRLLIDLFSYSPLAFGLPPLKLPQINGELLKRFHKLKSKQEIDDFFTQLSSREEGNLKALLYYDFLRQKYYQFIALFYSAYTIYQFYDIEKQIDEVEELDHALTESIDDLKLLADPNSCAHLSVCLDEFRSMWQGKGQGALEEAKASCRLVYNLDNSCD
jgi:hypothetical protein